MVLTEPVAVSHLRGALPVSAAARRPSAWPANVACGLVDERAVVDGRASPGLQRAGRGGGANPA